MPVLTKINTNVIADDAITAAKTAADSVTSDDIAPDIVLTGGSVGIPSVTTANLPGAVGGTNAAQTATNGMLVYNTTLGMLQQRSAGTWKGIAAAPTITSFTYSDGAAATAEKTVVGLVSVSCTTQTSTTVLVPGASLGIQVGMVVAGAGIPVGATVVSVIEDTSFVISAAATASATVTLTFGGAVTITGSNFDSILAGGASNIQVTFDGTTATSISVNSLKTIITCTPPAHAAGTITLLLTNASGLTASTDFVYDIEPIFTTSAGSLGGFLEAAYTANASAPRIQGTEDSVALTTGFERVTSATDDTVITTTVAGLTLQGTGYLTGTLAGTNATTYPFYATAKDAENQRTAPRLFNIIVYDQVVATGGTITTYSGYKVHTYNYGDNMAFNVTTAGSIDYLFVAGGGGGGNHAGGGGGGAGGMVVHTDFATAVGNYTVVVGAGGTGGTTSSTTPGTDGGDSSINVSGTTTADGGGGAHYAAAGTTGGSGGGGGGAGSNAGGTGTGNTGGTVDAAGNWGNDGGASYASQMRAGGGGGASAVGGAGTSTHGGAGGAGLANSFRTGSNVTYAGGGGGGTHDSPGTGGAGGSGGGGDGAPYSSSAAGGSAGTDGLGGGGGGAGGANGVIADAGFDGGNGIVVIRYRA